MTAKTDTEQIQKTRVNGAKTGDSREMRRAAVDVGSNSVLLTVLERRPDGWHELLWTSTVTGLGTGTKNTGLLQPEPQTKTLQAIKEAFSKASELGAECVAAATMAVRIATNAGEFLKAAEGQGTPVRVLSGEEEAQLGLDAVLTDPTFASYPLISVIDPGGHSTELTTASRVEVAFRHSFPIGALGLRETTLGADAPDSAARFAAMVEIDEAIKAGFRDHTAGTPVALGATPTNLASIRNATGSLLEPPGDKEALDTPVHGQWLSYEEVSKAASWMSEMREADRRELPGIEKGREKTLHIGALILERFLNAIHADGCFVSTRGWRHALVENDLYFS